MTVTYISIAIREYLTESSSPRKKLLILLLAPILAPLVNVIPIMTAYYIGYVGYVLARKSVKPDFEDRNMLINSSETRAAIDMRLEDEKTAMSLSLLFKLTEAVGEANLQAILG